MKIFQVKPLDTTIGTSVAVISMPKAVQSALDAHNLVKGGK